MYNAHHVYLVMQPVKPLSINTAMALMWDICASRIAVTNVHKICVCNHNFIIADAITIYDANTIFELTLSLYLLIVHCT